MKDYSELISGIVKNVGGKANVKKCFHCLTRIRLELADMSAVNIDALKQLSGTLGAQVVGDQLQIIIGTHVNEVCDQLAKELGIEQGEAIKENLDEPKKKFSLANIMAVVTPCIVP